MTFRRTSGLGQARAVAGRAGARAVPTGRSGLARLLAGGAVVVALACFPGSLDAQAPTQEDASPPPPQEEPTRRPLETEPETPDTPETPAERPTDPAQTTPETPPRTTDAPRTIKYTPAVLPEKGLGEFPGFEDKKIRLPLSLEDAVRIALRNNLDIQVEELNRNIARRQVIIEQAIFDPFFNMSFTYADNREPTVSPLDFDPLNPVLGVRVNPFEVGTFRTGLRGTTLLGTSYQISAVESRFDSPEASLFALNPRYSTRLEVTVTQPLMRGAWYETNSANIRIARNNLWISESQFKLIATDIIYNVVSAYWDLVFAHENYKSAASALQLAIDQLRIDRQRERVGAIAKIDLINPESQLAARKTEFDQAITLFENTRDTILVAMNYTGRESLKRLWERRDEKSPFENILILPTDDPETALLVYDRNESLTKAFRFREEYRRLDYQIENQDILVDVARNRLLPALDLSATWTQLGLDENFRGSIDSVESGRFYDWQVGLTLEVPLTYRGPLGEYRNARDEHAKLVIQKQGLENTIVLEVDQAIRDLRESFRTVRNLEHEVELQQALLEAERAKLRVGRSIAYTVSQIENDLIIKQAQENRAKTNFEKFKASYERAVGTLLEQYGVVLVDEE